MWDLCDKLHDYRPRNNRTPKSFKWTPVSCGQEYFIQAWCINGDIPRACFFFFLLNHGGKGSPQNRELWKTAPATAIQVALWDTASSTMVEIKISPLHLTYKDVRGAISLGTAHFYSAHTKADSLMVWRKKVFTELNVWAVESVPWWWCERASSAGSVFTVLHIGAVKKGLLSVFLLFYLKGSKSKHQGGKKRS